MWLWARVAEKIWSIQCANKNMSTWISEKNCGKVLYIYTWALVKNDSYRKWKRTIYKEWLTLKREEIIATQRNATQPKTKPPHILRQCECLNVSSFHFYTYRISPFRHTIGLNPGRLFDFQAVFRLALGNGDFSGGDNGGGSGG